MLTDLRSDARQRGGKPGADGTAVAPHVVILGGGYAGAATAIKLLDLARSPLRISIIEPRTELGRGLAYSTRESAHLMNGPAKLFSLHPERPEHFAQYLARFAGEWNWSDPLASTILNSFAPRSVFGDYVRSELARAVAAAALSLTFEHVASEAADVRRRHGRIEVALATGRIIAADHVVLATGAHQSQPDVPLGSGVTESGRYIADPWNTEAFEQLPREGTVLLVGSGLTMLDAVLTLEARGFRGRYLAISRRGHIVHPRREVTPLRDFLAEAPLPTTARQLLRAARRALANVTRTRPDWQSLVMAIRPHVSTLWERAGEEERARFLRHLRPIWEVSLHRAPPRAALLLDRGRAEGWFRHEAARLTGLNAAPGGRILARLRKRGRTAEETVVADAVINCTGASYDWSRSRGGFNARLLESGLVRPGPLSFGVDADAQCAAIGRDGVAAADLSVIGPALRGVRWESNTLVEILQQAIQLANRLSLLPPSAASAVSELTTVETTKAS